MFRNRLETMQAGAVLQKTYSGWDEMGTHFALGRLFWGGDQVYQAALGSRQWLVTDPASPWMQMPWNLPLEPRP